MTRKHSSQPKVIATQRRSNRSIVPFAWATCTSPGHRTVQAMVSYKPGFPSEQMAPLRLKNLDHSERSSENCWLQNELNRQGGCSQIRSPQQLGILTRTVGAAWCVGQSVLLTRIGPLKKKNTKRRKTQTHPDPEGPAFAKCPAAVSTGAWEAFRLLRAFPTEYKGSHALPGFPTQTPNPKPPGSKPPIFLTGAACISPNPKLIN